MNIIVAADKNWAIGNRGQLLTAIPADQKLFREETLGKVVVMGRKTLESLPGGRPFSGRMNIVLSKNHNYHVAGATVCHSLLQALELLADYPSEDIFICGGQKIYELFLPYCEIAHVTWIDYAYQADTYFPDLMKDEAWELAIESEEQTYFDICYEFRMYQKKSMK